MMTSPACWARRQKSRQLVDQRYEHRFERQVVAGDAGRARRENHSALTESLFRLDLQASFNAPLLEETFQIGEAASDMVIVSQRMRVTQSPQQPSVAA